MIFACVAVTKYGIFKYSQRKRDVAIIDRNPGATLVEAGEGCGEMLLLQPPPAPVSSPVKINESREQNVLGDHVVTSCFSQQIFPMKRTQLSIEWRHPDSVFTLLFHESTVVPESW